MIVSENHLYLYVIGLWFLATVLEFSFRDCDYSVNEGSGTLNLPISFMFSDNQNPFTITLSTITVETAESRGLGDLISAQAIFNDSRATSKTCGVTFFPII